MFVQRHAPLALTLEDGSVSPMEGPIRAMERQRQAGAPSPTHWPFLSLLGLVPRGSHARIFQRARHAADVCLGSVQSRTNVRLKLTSQLPLQVQLRSRLTLRHIHSHGGNVGNERADHAAALGAPSLVSSHNV